MSLKKVKLNRHVYNWNECAQGGCVEVCECVCVIACGCDETFRYILPEGIFVGSYNEFAHTLNSHTHRLHVCEQRRSHECVVLNACSTLTIQHQTHWREWGQTLWTTRRSQRYRAHLKIRTLAERNIIENEMEWIESLIFDGGKNEPKDGLLCARFLQIKELILWWPFALETQTHTFQCDYHYCRFCRCSSRSPRLTSVNGHEHMLFSVVSNTTLIRFAWLRIYDPIKITDETPTQRA